MDSSLHRLLHPLELDQWIRLQEVDSTNDYLMHSSLPAGTIVTAGKQSKGRGRSGRQWREAPQQGLYFSGILGWEDRPPGNTFSLAMALGLLDALQNRYPQAADSVALKWPNDLVRIQAMTENGEVSGVADVSATSASPGEKLPGNSRSGKERADVGSIGEAVHKKEVHRMRLEKLGGILIEGKSNGGMWQTVVGIGINWLGAPEQEQGDTYAPGFLFPANVGQEPREMPEDFVPDLIAALNRRALQYEQSNTLQDFQKWDVLQNRHIQYDGRAMRVAGLDREGALLLEDGSRITDSARTLEILWS